MLAAIALIGVSLVAEPWALPHAGKALNQNELTYFSDCLIVDVAERAVESDFRSVSTPGARFDLEVLVQDVTVVSSNCDALFNTKLVFTPHLPHTQKAGKPGWINLPLEPGRYFVMGKTESRDILMAYPGFVAYGWKDESVYPNVPRALFEAKGDDEFAVFHIVPTSSRVLASPNSKEASAVLKNLVEASLNITGTGRTATFDLVLRTGHRAFEEWFNSASGASRLLVNWSEEQSGTPKALSLLIAYHMGRQEVETELFATLAAASKEDPRAWATPQMARRLAYINSAFRPTTRRVNRVTSHERQVELLYAFSEARSEPVRHFLARNLSKTFSEEMEPA